MADHFTDFGSFDVAPEYRPLGAWAYFGYSILFNIPILGWILIIVFSISGSNLNRRGYARYHLITLILSLILVAVAYFTGALSQAIVNTYGDSVPSYLAWLVAA